jgi:hypothetical protein
MSARSVMDERGAGRKTHVEVLGFGNDVAHWPANLAHRSGNYLDRSAVRIFDFGNFVTPDIR